MKTKSKIIRFNLDSANRINGSTFTNGEYLLKIPYTFEKSTLYLEAAYLQYGANTLDTFSGIQIRSSSFGSKDVYSDSSDYGILESFNVDITKAAVDTNYYFRNFITTDCIGFAMNDNTNLNNFVLNLAITSPLGVVLTDGSFSRVKYYFMIVGDEKK